VLESLESGKARPSQSSAGRSKAQKTLPFEEERVHRPLKFSLTRLSYTQLDTFRTCPLKYQFRYMLHVPAPMPPIVNFGSSLHNTLRDFYAFLQKNPDHTKKDLRPVLKKFFEKHWIPGGYESRAIGEAQKKLGYETLERFYTHEKKNLVIPKFLEKSFSIKLGNVEVTGRIDRIDQLPDGMFEVIDYKSGASSEKNLSKDLQLSIYALACQEVLKIPVSRLSLYYLENLEKVSTSRTERDLAACREEIIKFAEELRASDFSPTPGFHCRFCDFRLICPVAAPMVR
jgi:DNA helicase-2/ATP-dependent DNA helicase PcrA